MVLLVEVLEVFARLNTYSVALNKQELRNGRFFGLFKQSMYQLAYEHLEFWRRQRIRTNPRPALTPIIELSVRSVFAPSVDVSAADHSAPNAPTVRRQHTPTNHVAIVVVVPTRSVRIPVAAIVTAET